jgi:hypothetical protein
MDNRLELNDLLPSLESLMDKINNNDFNILTHHKDALSQVIEHMRLKRTPLEAYFALEDWLYSKENKEKSVDMKSSMIWGALFVLHKMEAIDWDQMRRMYGEFMSKTMKVR